MMNESRGSCSGRRSKRGAVPIRDRVIGTGRVVEDENAVNAPTTPMTTASSQSEPMHRDAAQWMPCDEAFSVRLTQFPGAGDERVPPRTNLLPATTSVDRVGVCEVPR
jgi:hypothetical protein